MSGRLFICVSLFAFPFAFRFLFLLLCIFSQGYWAHDLWSRSTGDSIWVMVAPHCEKSEKSAVYIKWNQKWFDWNCAVLINYRLVHYICVFCLCANVTSYFRFRVPFRKCSATSATIKKPTHIWFIASVHWLMNIEVWYSLLARWQYDGRVPFWFCGRAQAPMRDTVIDIWIINAHFRWSHTKVTRLIPLARCSRRVAARLAWASTSRAPDCAAQTTYRSGTYGTFYTFNE